MPGTRGPSGRDDRRHRRRIADEQTGLAGGGHPRRCCRGRRQPSRAAARTASDPGRRHGRARDTDPIGDLVGGQGGRRDDRVRLARGRPAGQRGAPGRRRSERSSVPRIPSSGPGRSRPAARPSSRLRMPSTSPTRPAYGKGDGDDDDEFQVGRDSESPGRLGANVVRRDASTGRRDRPPAVRPTRPGPLAPSPARTPRPPVRPADRSRRASAGTGRARTRRRRRGTRRAG